MLVCVFYYYILPRPTYSLSDRFFFSPVSNPTNAKYEQADTYYSIEYLISLLGLLVWTTSMCLGLPNEGARIAFSGRFL